MFTWIPIYKEIAEKLKEFEKKQPELIKLLKTLKDSGLPVISLDDVDKNGKEITLEEIDPFTFLACFNRGIKDTNRTDIIKYLKTEWTLKNEIPSDFSGIPLVNNMRSWFFGYKKDRNPSDISQLWKLFNEVLKDKIQEKTFNDVLKIHGVKNNITMALFWINPEKYLNIDKVNTAYLKKVGIDGSFNDYSSYMKILQEAEEKLDKEFYQFSFDAWQSIESKRESEKDSNDVGEGVASISLGEIRIWMYAPGQKAKYWDECLKNNYMIFGANELDDFLTYKTREDIVKALQKANNDNSSYKNDSLACWQFSREIKSGDIIIAKKGASIYLGYGIVTGSYRHDSTRDSYRNLIPVKWVNKGEVEETQGPIVQKTLTDITRYTDYVKRLVDLLGIDFNVEKAIDNELEGLPLNLILYGPPGTGKTFTILNEYIPRYFTTKKKAQSRQEFLNETVDAMTWFQVIALAMLDHNTVNVPKLVLHEAIEAKAKLSNNNNINATLWLWLQMHTIPECENVKYSRRSEPAVFWKHNNSQWEVKQDILKEVAPEIIENHNKLKNYKAIETEEKRYEFVTFHQSFSYEDFIEGIKPEIADDSGCGDIGYSIKDGVFKHIASIARMNPKKKYALFIDEINRGNIAGIFGELITLIEKDKREVVSATLPYSKAQFTVPKNLYIIGTMNTADRSIEALDTALRRRFSFKECPPDSTRISQTEMPTVGIDLEAMLDKVNQRIEVLLDKDHTIGHSFFMQIENKSNPLDELKTIFKNNILPLLNEYFYNDQAKIKMVLGPAFIEEKEVPDNLFFPIEGDNSDVTNFISTVYSVKIPDTLEGFRSIYE